MKRILVTAVSVGVLGAGISASAQGVPPTPNNPPRATDGQIQLDRRVQPRRAGQGGQAGAGPTLSTPGARLGQGSPQTGAGLEPNRWATPPGAQGPNQAGSGAPPNPSRSTLGGRTTTSGGAASQGFAVDRGGFGGQSGSGYGGQGSQTHPAWRPPLAGSPAAPGSAGGPKTPGAGVATAGLGGVHWSGRRPSQGGGGQARYLIQGVAHARVRVEPYRFTAEHPYHRYRHGEVFPPALILGAFFIQDYLDLGLAQPPYGAEWVRFGPDAVLVDRRTGEVLDTVYGVYDDGYDYDEGAYADEGPYADGGAYPPPAPPSAQLYDNWNGEPCDYTDNAVLDVERPIQLDRLDLWVAWRPGETSVNFRVFADGQPVGDGVLQRSDCDPYQGGWCAATDAPAIELDPGRYVIQLDHPAVCRNQASQGAGFIRAWGSWR